MKKILIILILISGFAKAQTPTPSNYLVQPAKWKFVNKIWADSGIYIDGLQKYPNQLQVLCVDSVTKKIGYKYITASGGTVTSVSALTLGTSGTDLSSTVANSTTTPVITLNVPTASASNRGALSSTDWSTFNNKLSTATAASTYLPLAGGTMTGNLLFTDNTYDIGASGATRPRTGYFGTSLFSPLVVGGTGTTQTLTFQTTTGVGATGAAMYFKVGNNGAKTSITIKNNGTVEITDGAITPQTGFPLNIGGGTSMMVGNAASDALALYHSGGTLTAYLNGGGNFGTNGKVKIGSGVDVTVNAVCPLQVDQAPTASANFGLVSFGNGAWNGSTSGFFTGSSAGTLIAGNLASGSTSDLLNLQVAGVSGFKVNATGLPSFNTTTTTAGTTGNQTINKPTGTVNIAAAGTTVTVTNSLVTASSIVYAVIRTSDATATIKNVVPASGSFVINLAAAASSEVSIGFIVFNQ